MLCNGVFYWCCGVCSVVRHVEPTTHMNYIIKDQYSYSTVSLIVSLQHTHTACVASTYPPPHTHTPHTRNTQPWSRKSHGTGTGYSTIEGFWLPPRPPTPPQAPPTKQADTGVGGPAGGGGGGGGGGRSGGFMRKAAAHKAPAATGPPPAVCVVSVIDDWCILYVHPFMCACNLSTPLYLSPLTPCPFSSSPFFFSPTHPPSSSFSPPSPFPTPLSPHQVDLLPLPEGTPETVQVMCNGKGPGTFLVRQQRVVYEDKEMSASRFEALCGRADAKKWKTSLFALDEDGDVGLNMGDWLSSVGLDKVMMQKLTTNYAQYEAYQV